MSFRLFFELLRHMQKKYYMAYFKIDIFKLFWRPSAASTRLWVATVTWNHLKMAEMVSATQKNTEMTYHMCACPKNHLEAAFIWIIYPAYCVFFARHGVHRCWVGHDKWYTCNLIFVKNDIMIDYGLFMMIYKPSKLIYSSVHIDRVYHFIRDHFSRIPLYTYISFNGPRQCVSRVILVVSNLCMGGISLSYGTRSTTPPPNLLPSDVGPNIGQSKGREERRY